MFFFREQPRIETERLIIREVRPDDADGMFALDSDPRVHRFLGNRPATTIEESRKTVHHVRRQYETFGIGRWAVEEKATGRFIGWTGFKWIDEPINGRRHYLDVGYRFVPESWGKGIATEAIVACMELAAEAPEMGDATLCGMVVAGNAASERILTKLGMRYTETFTFEGEQVRFFEL